MELELDSIYAEINRKRALLGITEKDFTTNKRKKTQNNTHRELLISSMGGVMFR